MKKLLKIIVGIIAGLVALFAVAAIVVSFIDANRFKPQIVAKVKQATGRDLAIGNIHLSLFPVVGARLKDVSLGNAAGFGQTPQVAVGEADVGVRLLPLIFDRRIEAGRITLSDAQVDLQVAADGHDNWSDLSQHGGQAAATPAAKSTAASAGSPLAFSVGGIDIRNAAVHYADHKAGKSYAVEGLNLSTGAIEPGKPFDFHLDLKTQVGQPAVQAAITASGRASFDPASSHYSVTGLDLQIDGNGSGLPNGHVKLALAGNIDGTPDAVSLDGLKLKLDDTTVTGKLALTSLKRMTATFALKADQFDLDRYLPPSQKNAAGLPESKPTQAGGKSPDDTRIPVDALDAFGATGTLDIGRLKAQNLTTTDVHLEVNAPRGADKRIRLTAKLYDGTVAATTGISPGATPRFTQSAKLQQIDLGALLKDYLGKDKMTGRGNVDLGLRTAGNTVGALKRGLNGDVSFALKNASVKGFNLAQMIRQGQALAGGQQLQSQGSAQQTDFSEITGGGTIVDGVLHADKLDGRSPLLRVTGAGTVDLVHESIDYVAQPTIVNSTSGQGGRDVADLSGITIPVHVTGSFSDPHYSLDVKTAVKQKAVQKLTEQLNKKNPELGNMLQGLFGHKQDNGSKQPH